MSSNSVTLHSVLKATPQKIYRAFTESNALASWLPPYGFICVVHNMDVKRRGDHKMSFINFSTGNSHSFGGQYPELKPDEFLKYTDGSIFGSNNIDKKFDNHANESKG